jgi:hypothetical protein
MRVRVLIAMLVVFLTAWGSAEDVRSSSSRVILPESLAESLAYRDDPVSPVARLEEAARSAVGSRPARLPSLSGGATPVSPSRPRNLEARTPCRRGSLSTDVPIATDPAISQSAPSIAASPRRSNSLVTAYSAIGFPSPASSRCFARRSSDWGKTWSEAVRLPTLDEGSACTRVTLAYSRNGRRLYAAYTDDRTTSTLTGETLRVLTDTDIVVAFSENDGRTWSDPVVALDAAPQGYLAFCPGGGGCRFVESIPGTAYERPSIATPSGGYSSGRVYVTGTRVAASALTGLPPTAIAFSHSPDGGRSWSEPEMLDEGERAPRLVVPQGARVVGGPGREVFVAWYHSGSDAFKEGSFEIRLRRSTSAGEAWDEIITAARDADELTNLLGPSPIGKTWWTGMFPDMALERDGRVHVVYARDPEPGGTTAEQGDIRYVSSRGPAYDDWSLPVTVNDDGPGRAQAYASIAVRRWGSRSAVDVVWEDTRLAASDPVGPPESNTLYDIFHARLPRGHDSSWSPNLRVSDRSSLQDAFTTGERNALAASPFGVVFAVWADRRNRTAFDQFNEELWGSLIPVW